MVPLVSSEDEPMSMAGQERSYKRENSVVFCKTREEFGGLSNMAAKFPLRVNGIVIRTSEALYQACRFPHMPDVQRLIIAQKSPMTAKMKSKSHYSQTREDWDAVRVRIMRWCLRAKLACNWESFRSLLLATGDRPIVELSKKDDFWGAKVRGDDMLVGANVLGRLLMELRQELRGDSTESLLFVEPPDVDQFLLYGETIRLEDGARHTDMVAEDVPGGMIPNLMDASMGYGVGDRSFGSTTVQLKANATDEKTDSGDTEPIFAREYPKRLIEVDLPIKEISAQARREKSIRHGHISTLHIWWARRPLAACRAVLCASLWPDPADPLCPEQFRKEAADTMRRWRDQHGGKARDWANSEEVREALLGFIADFANYDHSTQERFLNVSTHLTQAAHQALGGTAGTRPLVVDPFAGGGAIPLEALRMGADAFASDLNSVAVLLNKVVLEYIPQHGERLASEVTRWGAWVKKRAEAELGRFYAEDPDGAVPIAYLWARTIRCEGPGCGAEVPLMRSKWLSKKRRRSFGMRLVLREDRDGVDVEIVENPKAEEVNEGTVRRGSATCPCCGYTTPVTSVRTQLKARRGGAADAKLLCVVTIRPGMSGRFYRLPTDKDLQAVVTAEAKLAQREAIHQGVLSLVPDESTRDYETFVNRGPIYGMLTWADYFSPRQALALVTFARLVREAGDLCRKECGVALGEALITCFALILGKTVQYNSSLCRWKASGENVVDTFGRQALPMVWDFAEPNPLGGASGDFLAQVNWHSKALESTSAALSNKGHVQLASATKHPLPDDAAHAFVTDPPYYFSVQYADLSDFFYVWLRRTLHDVHADLFERDLSLKADEIIVQTPAHQHAADGKNNTFYESRMQLALAEARRTLAPNGIGTVVFAHTSTVGWEAMLRALVDAGWVVTASWPIDTEMASRVIAQGRSVLASSVHLVCRPRENPDGSLRDDAVGDWRTILRELPERIHTWMPRLAQEGIVGADAIFACLGPALEIFSRYSIVEKVSGEQVELREYLEHVWAAVAREALSMIFEDADTTGLEEDARLTAMWLWTLSTSTNSVEASEEETTSASKAKSSAGFSLEFDAARKIAQGLGAHLQDLGHVVEIKGDQARLLSVTERSQHLFGKDHIKDSPVRRPKRSKQLSLFDELEDVEKEAGWGEVSPPPPGKTTLDRIHQAMVLFAAGRGEALKRFLVEEGVGSVTAFWKLAQSLSALYPSGTDEKRWVEGVLASKKGLGF